MLDFVLALLFPLVSYKEIFIRLPLSPDFGLVPTDFFVVQSIHIHQSDGGFELIVRLKFQTVRYISQNGLGGQRQPVQLGLMGRRVEPGFDIDTDRHIKP
jgi:hypothetical protein